MDGQLQHDSIEVDTDPERTPYTRAMALDQDSLLSDLTEAQRAAAIHVDGAALVLAGPGSGKTRVITRRIAHLVSIGVPAWQILAVTFTNKAAGEMRDRVDRLLPPDVPGRRGLTVATFHGFCARLLRDHAVTAGISPDYSIYDSSDQRTAMKQALEKAGLDSTNWPPQSMLAQVSHAKNALQSPEDFRADAGDFHGRMVAKAYDAYQSILDANHAVDFDDLLRHSARLLRQDEAVRTELQERFRYVLIDEYQDTNHAQFVIANAIAAAHGNLFVVGDPDQSIYAWRGADIRNILDFEEHHPGATTIPLGRNFRSTGHIVRAASEVIGHNRRRKAKELTTELEDGQPIRVVKLADEHQEARHVVDHLRKLADEGLPWRSMAILYRVNALSRVLEDQLRREGVPYVIARGTAFYDRKEIRDALAYLRMLANPADDVAFRRIVNVPTRGIGESTIKRVEAAAAAHGRSLSEACGDESLLGEVATRSRKAVLGFAKIVAEWRRELEAGDSTGLGDLVSRVLRESGLERPEAAFESEEERQRQANLAELVSAASDFVPPSLDGSEGGTIPLAIALREYLESVALVSDADAIDSESGVVTLMTLHAAKGLEYHAIAIVGVEDGLLPHSRARESDVELEEERRLFFVGMTRAERDLMVTSAGIRTVRGMRQATIASQFLKEVPDEHCEREDFADTWGTDDEDEDGLRIEYDEDPGEGLAAAFRAGTVVRHAQFGTGVVASFMPRGRVHSVVVDFKAAGRKTLVLEYAKLQRVEF